MKSAKKIRVAVLYGGRSGEHEVSLISAAAIVGNLDQEKFDVIPVSIDKKGQWLMNDLSLLENAGPNGLAVSNSHSVRVVPQADPNQQKSFDVVFPILHGTMGEDGTMQGLLELADLPYVGCGVLASAMGMDKDISKRLAVQAGVPIVPYITMRAYQMTHVKEVMKQAVALLKFPLFVKPANAGSSVGITKVHNQDELLPAIHTAFQHDQKILIEQGVDAREIEFAVLESLNPEEGPLVSAPGEIIPKSDEFYSYDAKYLDADGATILAPTTLTPEQLKTLQDYSRRIFRGLECNGLARIDFFIEKRTGKIFFNEINTMPGFTQISMFPKLWLVSGMSYSELLTHLVELAIQRHKGKHHFKHLQ
jgi:D-alanine-D-alanine ligase